MNVRQSSFDVSEQPRSNSSVIVNLPPVVDSYVEGVSRFDKDTSLQSSINKIQVDISPGTDLNKIGGVSQVASSQMKIAKLIPDQVYENLPPLLKDACQVFTNRHEREVFLVGTLGIISGILPNIKAYYRGTEIEANLFVFLLGQYGIGKGALEWARKIGQPIHKQKREEYETAKQAYLSTIARYARRDKDDNEENDEKPVPPANFMLFIPANNSQTGFYQLLSENKGRGILFESEGDTLADTLKKDYGNFSDGLRKSFHHEKISYFRRGGSEHVEIEEPCLSVTLSSTFDQLQKLIPTPENGLFSRFIYYELQASPEFDDVFDTNKNNYKEQILKLGNQLKLIYNLLDSLERPYWFELQKEQQKKFLDYFQEYKNETTEFVSADMGGSVNRLGIICFRIAMIFSSIRELSVRPLTNRIVCTDQDFENALHIMDVLKMHSLAVYWRLKDTSIKIPSLSKEDPKLAVKQQECRELRSNNPKMGYRAIAKIVFGHEDYRMRAYRAINDK